MSSLGFWNPGVLNNGKGVRSEGVLVESPVKRRGAPVTNRLGAPAKITLLGCDRCNSGSGVFFFRALDRLKVGVWMGGDELLVRMAGVLVTSGDVLPDVTAGLWGLTVELALVDDVRVIFPNAVVSGAGVGGCFCGGVW